MTNKGKVLISMSGGIDSSVAAMILLDQGYELVGVTYKVWDYLTAGCKEKEKGCCSLDSIHEAKEMADKLGFPHHVLDLKDVFNNTVIQNFISEYTSGNTPNPCVECNYHIKWGVLVEKADELDCEFIATGHYAQIRKESDRFILSKGVDLTKDQSYFLWNLSQENLERTLFPLGSFTKNDIRKIAKEKGFEKLSVKRESQEICFIPDDDYRSFLKKNVVGLKEKVAEGSFISTNGEFLGKHEGFPFYTIGQRKGLGIAVGYPLHVVKIDSETNEITLGTKDDLMRDQMEIRNLNFIKYSKPLENLKVLTKIRYRDKGSLSTIRMKNDTAEVKFNDNVSSITPGQSAVFYEGDDVVGGGIIV